MVKSLVTLRQRRRLTQGEFAKLIGTSQQTVSRYERGLLVPSPYYMRRLLVLSQGRVRPNHFFGLR